MSPANTTGGEWLPLSYSRAFTSLAYDARDGYVVAFGGKGSAGQPLGDTWRYGRGNWSIVLTATAPSPRWGAAMDYDSAAASVVLFGGTNGASYFNDTWTYSGGVWTNLSLSRAPSPRAYAGITFDAASEDNYTVLFGGSRGATYFQGTWEFHQGAWTNLSSSITGAPPPALGGAAFAYDPHVGRAILFGGIGTGGYQPDTYQYRNLTWSILTTTGPSAVAYAGMAFDRAATELVLFGGYNGASYSGQTWLMTNETWSGPYTSSGPSARDGVSLAYDGLHRDNYVVSWGGYSGGSAYATDTWSFNATRWTEVTPGGHPAALSGASLVDIPANDYSVLFGGFTGTTYSSATWIFANGQWTKLTESIHPSARSAAAATYSSTLGGEVLFGGYGGGTLYFNDTWEFVNGAWTNVTSGTAPPARAYAGFTFEGTPVDASILFGGRNSTLTYSDTWEFNSTGWSELFPTGHPSARSDPAMTYDAPDGYVLLFGGLKVSQAYNDTWAYFGVANKWVNETSTMTRPSPAARYGAQAAYDPYNGYVVLTGGYDFTNYYNDTWGYISGNWTDFQPPSAPPLRTDAGLTYVRNDQFIAEFGGTGSGPTTLSDTWIWVAFSAVASATPNPTDVGVPVDFGVSATAGVLPYSYSWTFGDGGTNTTAAPVYAYAAPGAYVATVTVTDSKLPTHDQTTTNVTVVVNPALAVKITTIPAPSNGTVDAVPGYSIAFNSTQSGGTGPFTYGWRFGDGSVGSTENTTHAYGTVGAYNATVFVNDSVGGSANATVRILIVPYLAASVSLHPSTSDVGVPVEYSTTPIGGVPPYSYSWQFGDGTGAGPQSTNTTAHSYTQPGTFTVRFWVNDSALPTPHSFNTTLTVTIVALPSATLRAVPAPVDVGVPVTFNSTVSNGTRPYTYLWTFGDSSTATTENATHVFASAGPFTVTFNVTDALGQSAVATRTITVVAAPALTLSASPSVTEVGVPVSLSATVSGGVVPISYAWHFGDGTVGTGATVSHAYATPGVFVVTGWANDSLGVSAQATTTVHVSPRIASTPAASPISADVGIPVTFTGSSTGGVGPIAYAWTFGDGGSASTQNATHSYAAVGTYPVFLWANDSLGISGASETNVTVVADPSVSSFTVSPTSVKSGNSVTFYLTVSGGTGPFSFVYFGLPAGCASANQSTLTCRPSTTGTYTIHVNVTDRFGKLAIGSVSLTVTSSSSSTFLGLPAVEGYLLLAAIVIIAAALIAWAALRGGRGKKGTTPSDTPTGSEESTPTERPPESPPSTGSGS